MRLTRPIASLDLETTGLDVEQDRIVQIGVAKLHPDGHITEWKVLVNPLIEISEEAEGTHGITDEDVHTAKPFSDPDIYAKLYMELDGCDVCVYNQKFDLRVVLEEYRRIRKEAPAWVNVIDPLEIFRSYKPHTLEQAFRYYCGKELEGAHDALVDARASLDVLLAQVVKHHLPEEVDKLADMLNRPDPNFVDKDGKFRWRNGEAVFNFGNSVKGKKLRDVAIANPGYLQWMMRSDFSPAVKEVVGNALIGKFPARTE